MNNSIDYAAVQADLFDPDVDVRDEAVEYLYHQLCDRLVRYCFGVCKRLGHPEVQTKESIQSIVGMYLSGLPKKIGNRLNENPNWVLNDGFILGGVAWEFRTDRQTWLRAEEKFRTTETPVSELPITTRAHDPQAIESILADILTPDEVDVIVRLRLYLCTQQETADHLGMTRHQVREIERSADTKIEKYNFDGE